MDNQIQLLLTEFRAFRDMEFRKFRDDVATWKQETGERIAKTETQVKDLYGNGRDGRVTAIEKKLSRHSKIIWIAGGVLLCLEALASVAKLLVSRGH